jgi:hypothetical protein
MTVGWFQCPSMASGRSLSLTQGLYSPCIHSNSPLGYR